MTINDRPIIFPPEEYIGLQISQHGHKFELQIILTNSTLLDEETRGNNSSCVVMVILSLI